jgi:hypothetical protein
MKVRNTHRHAMENRLEIAKSEFTSAMQRSKGRLYDRRALLSFEGGFVPSTKGARGTS